MTLPVPAVGDQATAAFADALAYEYNNGFLGDNVASATVTLATATTNYAATSAVTFTLTQTGRVRIVTSCQFTMATGGVDGRYRQQSAYNSGTSATPASATAVGGLFCVAISNVGDLASGFGDGTVLLAAGTYTAYPLVSRNTGGTATDTARSSYTAVYLVGPV